MDSLWFYYLIFISASIIAALWGRRIQYYEENGYILGKSYKVLLLVMIFGLPTFILCVRSGIGVDYTNYYQYFERYKTASVDVFVKGTGTYEILNLFIIKTIYKLGGTYKTCFAAYGILTNLFFGLTLWHKRKQINLTHGVLLLYLVMFPEMTNVVRQMLAVSIILFSLRFCEQRKLVCFIICVIAAVLVHNSAIVCIAFYLVYILGENINSIKAKVLMVLLIISPVFTGFIFNSLSTVELLSKYYNAYDLNSSVSSSATLIFRLIAYLPAIISFRRNIDSDENNKYLYYLMLVDLALVSMGSVQKWGFRFAYYTMPVQVLIAAMCIKSQDSNFGNRMILKVFYVVYYMLQFYILYYLWGRSAIFPYTTIWH